MLMNEADPMEVDNEVTIPLMVQTLETKLKEIFEQDNAVKFKEKLEIFNSEKLAYKDFLLGKFTHSFKNFRSIELESLLKKNIADDQETLIKLDDKKISKLIEDIKSSRLEVLQGRMNYVKKELIETPNKLISLIQELQKKKNYKKAQIDFNQALKGFFVKVNPLNVNKDNSQLLVNLDEQINKLIKIIDQHEFINSLSEISNELNFYKNLEEKSQTFFFKHLDKNKFIEAMLFVNDNGDNNLNLLLDLIDPNTHECIIDSNNAPKILALLISILLEKDTKKIEACFPLINNLIQSHFLNAEHLNLLLTNLVKTTDTCSFLVKSIIQQLGFESSILDEALITAAEALKLVNVKLLLNLGADPKQLENTIKQFQEKFEDKKNKDQHQKQKYQELVSILEKRDNLIELNKSKTLPAENETQNCLLITDIIAIMRADTKRSKNNHPINEALCQRIIDKYKTVIKADIYEDYKSNLLRLMSKKHDFFANKLEKFIQLNTSNKKTLLDYLLSKAVGMTNIIAVELLLEKGADPKIIDGQGNTLLHLAARNNQTEQVQNNIIELIQILMNRGVDKQIKNKAGHTLFSQAINSDQQYLINFLSLNPRPDAAKFVKVNLSDNRKKLIADQKMIESELRKIEKGRHSTLLISDIPKLVDAWKVVTNFGQLIQAIEIENDEVNLNDHLENFNEKYKKTDLDSLKKLYMDTLEHIGEKLKRNQNDMPMCESGQQDELALSLINLSVNAAKQPKLEGTSTMFLFKAPAEESNLKHKKQSDCSSEDQTMKVSLSPNP